MLTFVGITFFGHILTKIQSSWFGPSCIFLDNRLYIHTIFLEEKLFLPPYHAIQAIFYRTLPLSWFISEMFHQIRTNPRRRILSSLSGLVFSFLRIANRPILFSLSAVLLQNLFVTSLLDTFVLEIHINKPNNLFLAKISKTFLLLWLFLKVKDTEFSYWSLEVYKCFLVETGPAMLHHRDIILCAVVKMGMWVTLGGLAEWGWVGWALRAGGRRETIGPDKRRWTLQPLQYFLYTKTMTSWWWGVAGPVSAFYTTSLINLFR